MIDGSLSCGLDRSCDALAEHDHGRLENARVAGRLPGSVPVNLNETTRSLFRHWRVSKAIGTSWVSKGRVRRVGQVDITVGVCPHASCSSLRWVLCLQSPGGNGLLQECCPGRDQPGELILKGIAGRFLVAGKADGRPQVSVELQRWDVRMGLRMERVHVLRNDVFDESKVPEVSYGVMAGIGPGSVLRRPSQEAPSPVPLSGFMTRYELVVVDGAERLVQTVCALLTPVVG